MQIINSLI